MANRQLSSYMQDFAELESRVWAEMLRRNKVANRLPARKRKLMYGKAKQPYTFIYDCIEVHGKERTKHLQIF